MGESLKYVGRGHGECDICRHERVDVEIYYHVELDRFLIICERCRKKLEKITDITFPRSE